MKLSIAKKVFLALVVANILWGMGPPIFKWAIQDIHIGTLAFLRFAIPTIFLGIVFNRQIKIHRKDIGLLLLVGLCDVTFNIAFYFLGISHTASINASIIVAASPIFLILGSMLLLKEKPTKKILLGNLIGLTGVLLIIVQPMFQKTQQASVFGNTLLLLSALAAVIGTIYAKKVIKKYSAISLTFWAFVVGTFSFFPFFLLDTIKYGLLPDFSYQGFIGLTFGIIGSSLIAYFLYYWSLKYLLASQTGVFFYLDPIASIVIAAPLLSEYPTIMFVFGTCLVFAGIYVAEKRIHYPHLNLLFSRD
ncbi:MAG TPA: DMT family transporter [Candidatus Saccharimonadales bacterium]|nr:DMT family transporter [Candidatus Saccharimonadales bacterium]